MFFFGHLGIGSKLVNPWSAGLPKKALLLGTVLPDLIDKPLYYALSWITGRHGLELGLISGTRTFGHTAIFLLTLSMGGLIARSRVLAALSLGVATHLLLDNLSDHFTGQGPSALIALLWPWMDRHFPILPYPNLGSHLSTLFQPFIFGAEIIGAGLLAWDYWKTQHEPEILKELKLRRFRIRKTKKHRTI